MTAPDLSPFVVPGVLVCLTLFSVVTWALLIAKLAQFARLKRADAVFLRRFEQAASLVERERVAARATGPQARLARAGFRVMSGRDLTLGGPAIADHVDRGDRLERALRQQIARERRRLEGGLAVLASFASTAPFIGLFGTVWGIMEALTGIHRAGAVSLQAVSGPVGQSLIATGVGIAVAVPAVLIHNLFVRRLKARVHAMNDFSYDFFALCQQAGFRLDPAASGPGSGADDGPVSASRGG